MKIKVQSINFDADTSLVEYVQDKANKLSKLYDKIIDGDVFLVFDKAALTENKVSEVKIRIPGKELFAKKQSKTFEEATDNAIEAIQKQLIKVKEKQRDK